MRLADLLLAIALCAVSGWMMSCMHESVVSRPEAGRPLASLQRLLSEVGARLPDRAPEIPGPPAAPRVVPVGRHLDPDSIPSENAFRPSGDYQC